MGRCERNIYRFFRCFLQCLSQEFDGIGVQALVLGFLEVSKLYFV